MGVGLGRITKVQARSTSFRRCHKTFRCASYEARLPIAMQLDLFSLIVDDYDSAIEFFVAALRFTLVEDKPSLTNDGRPKRWVVVRPPCGGSGLLLARADGERQAAMVGKQFAGRVGLFLRVDDFDASYDYMLRYGFVFVGEPRDEPYGKVVVFEDIAGNRWDLLSQKSATSP